MTDSYNKINNDTGYSTTMTACSHYKRLPRKQKKDKLPLVSPSVSHDLLHTSSLSQFIIITFSET